MDGFPGIKRLANPKGKLRDSLKPSNIEKRLHRFGQKTLLGVYRWLILSFISYLLAYWVYLHLGNQNNLDGFDSAQQALILLLPHVLFLSLLTQLQIVIPWLNERGFELCLMRCKI